MEKAIRTGGFNGKIRYEWCLSGKLIYKWEMVHCHGWFLICVVFNHRNGMMIPKDVRKFN